MLMAWVKFWYLGDGGPGRKSAITATVILAVAIFVFAWYGFYVYKRMIRAWVQKASDEVDAIEHDIKTVSKIWQESGIWAHEKVLEKGNL